jgi:hypothetical protein
MRNYLDLFPFALLSILLPFFFFNNPTLAHSLIISSLVAFCCFQVYLLENRKPDYEKKFQDALVYLEQQIKNVDKKTTEIRTEVVKSNAEKLGNTSNVKKFQF